MRGKRLLVCALVLSPLFLSGCFMDTIMGDFVNSAPRAVVDAKPLTGAAPLDVTFDAHYSHDDDGAIAEYHWDFGDPQDRTFDRSAQSTHVYGHAGTYLATLTVVDDEGATASQQVAIVVTNAPPVADASVSNDNPQPGREVTFNASASHDPAGEIASYHWDFDDGASADGKVVTHTYIEGGYYSVTLTVTDDEGASTSTHVGVNVQPGKSDCGGGTCGTNGGRLPYAVIMGKPSCGGAQTDTPIHFDGTASRAGEDATRITSYVWDLGDGTTATDATVTHVYTVPQRLVVVSLTVTNDLGESSTAYASFSVNGTCSDYTCPE
jgi:PKD repeat protein